MDVSLSNYMARLHDDNVAQYVIEKKMLMGSAVINMNRHMLGRYLTEVPHTTSDQDLIIAAAGIGVEKVVDVLNAINRDVLLYSDDSDDPRRYLTVLEACELYGIRHPDDDISDNSAVTLRPNHIDPIRDFKYEHSSEDSSTASVEDSLSVNSSPPEYHQIASRPIFYLSLPDDRTVDYTEDIRSYKHEIIIIPEVPYEDDVPELPTRKHEQTDNIDMYRRTMKRLLRRVGADKFRELVDEVLSPQ